MKPILLAFTLCGVWLTGYCGPDSLLVPVAQYRALVRMGLDYRAEREQNALLLSRLSLTSDSLADARRALWFARRDTDLTADTLRQTRGYLAASQEETVAARRKYRKLVGDLIWVGAGLVGLAALYLKGGSLLRLAAGLLRRG